MKRYFILFIATWLLSSCEKFLDVRPEDRPYESDLYADLSGFQMGLAGVYNTLNSPALYGVEMKFGFMESLVGTYNTPGSSHAYYRPFRHEYNYPASTSRIDAIWSQHYNVINQVNIMLQNIDNITDASFKNIVRGELIGLRAFSHFELFKLFGPVIVQEGIEAIAIPYRDKVEFSNVKAMSANEVIKNLNADLNEAKQALTEDPIRTSGRTANGNQYDYEQYNSLIDRRGNRMNYYAIVALQSMVAQWEGDLSKATNYAEEVLNELAENNVIRLSTPSEITSVLNKRTPTENIFSILNQNLNTLALINLPPIGDTRATSTSPLLFPNYTWLGTNLFLTSSHGSASDFRYKPGNWFEMENSISSNPYKLIKFHIPETYQMLNTTYTNLFEIKLISIHQLYMIAAEYYASTNPVKAVEYLNKVRNARDIITNITYGASLNEEILKDYIFDEVRKESIGEGNLFVHYKRLYKPIHRSTLVQPTIAKLKFPIPVNEATYNPQ